MQLKRSNTSRRRGRQADRQAIKALAYVVGAHEQAAYQVLGGAGHVLPIHCWKAELAFSNVFQQTLLMNNDKSRGELTKMIP